MPRFLRCLQSVAALCVFGVCYAQDASDLYATLEPSVFPVYISKVAAKQQADLGTAVAVAPHYLVTNCHVVASNHPIQLQSNHGFVPVTLAYGDMAEDVCLLYAPKAELKPVLMRPSQKVRIGEQVYVIGNPRGADKTMSEGIVSNKVNIDGTLWLQTDAAVNYGSSGGGLFDQNGRFIGLLTAKRGGFGYALPEEWVKQVLHEKPLLPLGTKQTGKAYADNVRHVHLIQRFDQVSLYGNAGKCFLYFVGTNAKNQAVSSAVWEPAQGGVLTLFPNASTVERSVWQGTQSVLFTRYEPHHVYAGQGMLQWDSQLLPLLVTRTKTGYQPPFVSSSLPTILLEGKTNDSDFTTNFKGYGGSKGTIHFGSKGLHAALKVMKQRCAGMF